MLNLHFDPFPVLETPRLILKRPSVDDAQRLFEMRTNEDVMRYVERPRPKSVEETVRFIADKNKLIDNHEAIAWSIYTNAENAFAGDIGFWRMEPEHFRAEVGYMLLPQYWKQGIMSEALEAVLRFGFDKMNAHTIEADLNPANEASIKLLEKFGFVREGYFKEDYYWEGKFLDTAVYSLIRGKGQGER